MLAVLLILPGLAAAATHAAAAQAKAGCAIPAEVAPEHQAGFCALSQRIPAFVARQDVCTHFAGEEPYNAARRRELDKAMAKYCDGSEATWARLRTKYRQDPVRDAWLDRYGEDAGLDVPYGGGAAATAKRMLVTFLGFIVIGSRDVRLNEALPVP
ncbi:hypothetical protein K8O61_08520 [Xanthomonas cerealis pv. cerealis]|uniref:hypothetical protein n=1 Tax=Xanthomonas cerealis TaxID=3390025 RepID=UPI001F15916B|nr:hypothetical protein [Xanthomonas translucens]UKE71033.1 hypothetical protein K8O61_08520 [Xanthomonas translucens pv. pistacia]